MKENEAAFIPAVTELSAPTGPCWWFCFSGYRLLVRADCNGSELPFVKAPEEMGLRTLRKQYLGTLKGSCCYSAELEEETEAPEGMVFQGLRTLHGQLDELFFRVAFTAVQITDWDRTVQFCSRCGTKCGTRTDVRAKECPECGFIVFPRISPAVIVLVERGRQVLLARSKFFAPGLYSVIAGFVEPGETLEETVFREVKEETGIEVRNIRYFGSQPWPFPNSLMIAFTAEYGRGEIFLDGEEIEDAGWFEPDRLPTIPAKISISRSLIDAYLEKYL